jgi:hypothetical protein
MNDSISTHQAGRIDSAWVADGYPQDGLRIVGYRISGNRYRTILTLPGDDEAPEYEYLPHDPTTGEAAPAYYHRSGPTLADWQRQQDEREFMAQWQEARREAIELYEWASGR